MIDYALKPPSSPQEINIEKINSTNDYLSSMNPENQKIFTKSYKYPYLAGEILSHDYPFLLDKIINIDFFSQENNTIGGELSMIKNTSNVDEGDEGGPDDSMGEFRNQQEPQEEDIDNNNNNTFFNTTIDNNLNNDRDNLELIDYLFNISFNYDLNPIQGGYLVKINRSLLHSLYSPNKSNTFINYICFKKPNDIISNFWNKIQFFYFQEILYDILMYCEEDNNQNNKLDLIKTNILTKLITTMKTQPEGIKDILCDYASNCKSVESLVNENFITKLCTTFATVTNEKILENFCIVTSHIIKNYKNDNFSSSKNIKPFEKNNNNFYNNFLNNSLGVLNFGDSDLLIGKLNAVLKEINLEYFKSTNSKIIFITFIYDFMTITRCPEFLENLININYFAFIKNLFYSSKNDIIQSIYLNIVQLVVEDSNEKWLNEILFKNNFIDQALNINYKIQSNNFGIKDNQLFVHISEIFDILNRNTFANEFLKKNNYFDKINNTFNTLYKTYIERMEKTICNFKCNSLYLPTEDSLRVDEIAEKGDIKNIGEFNRFNNIFKKNSFSSSVKKEIFFDGQPEGDIEKREDNFDDENDNENKNIIQNFPSFEDESQKEENKK